MAGRLLRGAALTVAVVVAVLSLALAARVGVVAYGPRPAGRQLAAQVRFLDEAIQHGAGPRMQQLFPEGHFFLTALTASAATAVPKPDLDRVRQWRAHLDAPETLAVFGSGMVPEHGIFQAGWSLSVAVDLAAVSQQPADRADVELRASAVDAALRLSPTGFPESYPQQYWPCDSVVAASSLARAARLLDRPDWLATVRGWRATVSAEVDPATGLLPHRVDPRSGRPLEGARATSQVVLLRFLADVDPVWSARDHRRFRTLFASTVPGVPGVREHPRGSDLGGDVDSGPIVLGLSASASTVELGTAVVHGDRETARALAGLAETTGAPLRWRGQKRYALGLLPVGDAFLAWAVTARRWVSPVPSVVHASAAVPRWWRLPWHLATLSLLVPVWTVALLLTARARRPGGPGPARDPSARSGSRCARWRCRWSAGSGQPGGSACSSWVRRGAIRP